MAFTAPYLRQVILRRKELEKCNACNHGESSIARWDCIAPSSSDECLWLEPGRGAHVEPGRGAHVEPGRGAHVEPGRGAHVEPGRGAHSPQSSPARPGKHRSVPPLLFRIYQSTQDQLKNKKLSRLNRCK